jgi:glutamate--cysteine ligase
MQAIAGVHFNLSLPNEFWQKLQQIEGDKQVLQSYISDQYFALIRNFKRELWLISYLFGASPTLCRSFLAGQNTNLPFESLSENTLYLPHATSLRLGDLGYTNSAQSSLRVTYNSLEEYLQGFKQAISMKSDLYQKFGDYTEVPPKQLNSNILQIENEFYSPIRPKRNAKQGQTPSEALAEGGVEYIEVRALDVNPFSEVGISKEQIQFLDVFLVYCVLKASPDLSWQAQIETQTNLDLVVNQGRAPDLELSKQGQDISLKQWAGDIFTDLKQIALLFDEGFETQSYSSVIAQFESSIDNPDNTFSGRLLAELKAEHKESAEFALELAKHYKSQLMSNDYTIFERNLLQRESTESTKNQRDIELSDNQTFVDFLSDYFN